MPTGQERSIEIVASFEKRLSLTSASRIVASTRLRRSRFAISRSAAFFSSSFVCQ